MLVRRHICCSACGLLSFLPNRPTPLFPSLISYYLFISPPFRGCWESLGLGQCLQHTLTHAPHLMCVLVFYCQWAFRVRVLCPSGVVWCTARKHGSRIKPPPGRHTGVLAFCSPHCAHVRFNAGFPTQPVSTPRPPWVRGKYTVSTQRGRTLHPMQVRGCAWVVWEFICLIRPLILGSGPSKPPQSLLIWLRASRLLIFIISTF